MDVFMLYVFEVFRIDVEMVYFVFFFKVKVVLLFCDRLFNEVVCFFFYIVEVI